MLKTKLSDYKINEPQLNGFEKRGRVKIRILGIHTEYKEKSDLFGVPTEELLWAEPMQPITEGNISGNGIWSVPLQGTHVIVFFLNNNHLKPIYMGSISGIYENKPWDMWETDKNKKGFYDKDKEYPTDDYINEHDSHRLFRADDIDRTIVKDKNDNIETGKEIALGGSWDEPQSYYEAEYPHNTVIKTHGGITIEIDSTKGKERFHLYHPSNTYIEIDHEGNMIIRNNKDKYDITENDKKEYTKGNYDELVDGNRTEKIKGTEKREIDGALDETYHSNQTIIIEGNQNVTISGNQIITASTINLN
jgi:hypothetical protein